MKPQVHGVSIDCCHLMWFVLTFILFLATPPVCVGFSFLAPDPPTQLQATAHSTPDVLLTWYDESLTETGFTVERRAAGSPSFGTIATLPANVTFYTDDDGLVTGTTYFYRVKATAAQDSEWSNTATATIPGGTSSFCRTAISQRHNAMQPWAATGPGFYGVVWRECHEGVCQLAYSKLDGSGAVLSGPTIVVAAGDRVLGAELVWGNGNWGLLWMERMADEVALRFATVDSDGTLLTPPVRLAPSTSPRLPGNSRIRGLAWDGSGWGVAWAGWVQDGTKVCFAHLSDEGTVDDALKVVSDSAADVKEVRLVSNGIGFAVSWWDFEDAQGHFRKLAPDGTPEGPSVTFTSGWSGNSVDMGELAWNGSTYGVLWIDSRDGDFAPYLRILDADGTPQSEATRMADSAYREMFDPVLRWDGSRWVVACDESSGAAVEIALSFADAAGAKVGNDVYVSTPADGLTSDYPGLAVAGGGLLVVWHDGAGTDSLEIHAQATDLDGDPGTFPRRILTSGHAPGFYARFVSSVFLGDGFAVTWSDQRDGSGGYNPRLRLIDADGVPTGLDVPVPATPPAGSAFPSPHRPTIAFSGEVIAIVWSDIVTGEVMLSRLDLSGASLGPDTVLSDSGRYATVIWTGEHFLAAWTDTGSGYDIASAAVTAEDGSVLATNIITSTSSGGKYYVALAGDGRARGAVWADARDGNWEIYGAALDPSGARIGSEVRLTTSEDLTEYYPALAYNGSDFLAVWHAQWPSGIDSMLLDLDLTPLGGATQLAGIATVPSAAWDGSQWAVVFRQNGSDVGLRYLNPAGVPLGPSQEVFRGGEGFVDPHLLWDGTQLVLTLAAGDYFDWGISITSLPCALDNTPPTCPTGLNAGIDEGAVDLTWTQGTDDDFALDWQIITRDGQRVAAVAPPTTSWRDEPVAPGPHIYNVSSLNQGSLYPVSACVGVTVDIPLFADGFENGDTSAWSLSQR